MLKLSSFGIRKKYTGQYIALITLGIICTAFANAENSSDESQWMVPQYTQSITSNLQDNRIVNAVLATKEAITVDFQKPQVRYLQYDWKDSSLEEETVKLNVRFRFH